MRKLILVLLAMPFAANADPITYYVDSEIGAGSAVGFFVTDGTLGELAADSILDYELTLTSANLRFGSPQTISFADATQIVVGPDVLFATPSDMLFDFDGPGAWWFVNSSGGVGATGYYGLGIGDACQGGCVGEFIGWNQDITGAAEASPREGLYAFASVAVPEPGTLVLLGIGLLGMGAARRRKKV